MRANPFNGTHYFFFRYYSVFFFFFNFIIIIITQQVVRTLCLMVVRIIAYLRAPTTLATTGAVQSDVDDCVIINGMVVRLILPATAHNTDFQFTHCDNSVCGDGSRRFLSITSATNPLIFQKKKKKLTKHWIRKTRLENSRQTTVSLNRKNTNAVYYRVIMYAPRPSVVVHTHAYKYIYHNYLIIRVRG